MRFRIMRSVFLAALFMTLVSVSVFASEQIPVQSVSESNPFYEDVPGPGYEEAPVMGASASGDEEYLAAEANFVEALRQGMVERENTIVVYYQSTELLDISYFQSLFHLTYEEGMEPLSGDYLHWSWKNMKVSRNGYVSNGIYYYTITYSVSYYTTAAQEVQVTAKIEEIISDLNFDESASDYEKIKAVYDYICDHVSYDTEGFNTLGDDIEGNEDYLSVTAYSALMEGEAVCQGYATLFYRMAEACGIDTRVIAGTSRNLNHAWNIVKLGQHYFNVDSTWDAGNDTKQYFLQSEAAFAGDHTRWGEYATEEFHAAYPMGSEYIPAESDNPNRFYTALVTDPTETAHGYTTYTFGSGKQYVDNYTGEAHSHTAVVTDPTCTTKGYTTYTCKCGNSYVDSYQDKLSHVWDSGKVTKEPTEQEQGVTTYICTKCTATKEEAIAKLNNPFLDIVDTSATNWYYRPVLWAVERAITNGVDTTHFAPEDACTRAQVVTFLWRAAGMPEPKGGNMPFTDIPGDAYYRKAVLWAVEQGITNGIDSTHFAPNESCTRAQVVTFLWRAAEEPAAAGSESGFSDTPGNAYYYSAVLWAVEQGITNGLGDGTFGTEQACTRAHVVTFLYRYYL